MADINNLANAIMNAVTAAQAANAANAAPPQQPTPFALVPGMSHQQPLDFTKGEDIKFFNKAIAPADNKFDLKEENLRAFLDVFQEHARIYNFTSVINIPDAAGILRNLITNYGQLDMQECLAFAQVVIAEQTRRAQNDMMMFQFVSNSLTSEARLKMVSNPSLYTVADTPSGLLFLKVLIGRSSIDTKAKTLLLRTEISSLPHKMIELKGNVREFNVYVEHKRQQLLGRGQAVEELIAHLFNAYLKVPDSDFIRYMQSKKDAFEEGTNMTDDELMHLAIVRYDLIIQQRAANSEGEDQVVAMIAQEKNVVNDSTDKLEALIAKMQSSSMKEKGKGGNKRRNNKHDPANAWKKVKPTGSDPQTKTVSGRVYHWCQFHELWTMHKPTDCTLGKQQHQNPSNTGGTDYSYGSRNKPSSDANLQLSHALLAMMNKSEDEEE